VRLSTCVAAAPLGWEEPALKAVAAAIRVIDDRLADDHVKATAQWKADDDSLPATKNGTKPTLHRRPGRNRH
jgi:hypothetical protein